MARNYTKRTASLKATFIDVRELGAKKLISKELDSQKIKVNGEDLLDVIAKNGLNLPNDYTKFMMRESLPTNKNWALYDDNGNLVYMNFSNEIVYGAQMFGSTPMVKFQQSLDSLENGDKMFYNTALASFDSSLPSLRSGTMMFEKCKLDGKSVENILTSIPSVSNGAKLDMDVTANGCEAAATIIGISVGTTIPYIGDSRKTFTYKGWNVSLACVVSGGHTITGDYVTDNDNSGSGSDSGDDGNVTMAEYNVTEGSEYFSNPQSWNNEVYQGQELYKQIKSVRDGYVYDTL